MSGALYKFLRKAELAGDASAPLVMDNIKAKARYEIINRLARARGGETGHLLGEDLPHIGEKAKQMILDSKDDLRNARMQNSAIGDTYHQALDMLDAWKLSRRPGRRLE